MKIRKIELQNNSFFGNQVFDFSDSHGNVYDNVVLAGENGSGKTQLLNIIYDFCKLSLTGDVTSEIRIFSIVLSQEELRYVSEHVRENLKFVNPTGNFEIVQDFSAQSNTWNRIKVKYEKTEGDGSLSSKDLESSWFFNDVNRNILFKSVFSTVGINYDPKVVKTVTALEVDEEMKESIRSGTDLATEIQQLLVDIQSNDAMDLKIWVDEHRGEVPADDVIDKRITRFKNAFATMFNNLNFYRISNDKDNKKVVFKKDNQEVEISALSSGEKQIVFRGAFLLRNQQSSTGCCILIDEPEISLHPLWQDKVFDYYRDLFIDNHGKQTSQIIMATHSQYVLKSALNNKLNTLILLLKSNSGKCEVSHMTVPQVLPKITSAELNYNAFGIASIDYHIQLYGHLQDKYSLNTILKCDKYIKKSPLYDCTIHRKKYSYTDDKGKKRSYQTLPTYIRNTIDHPDNIHSYNSDELRTSIEFLITLCK